MVTLFAKHKVDNYDTWKKAYDDFSSLRNEFGVSAASVHRDVNDKNVVVITHQFDNADSALAFANSDELKAGMQQAGVSGPPEFWFAENVEQTT